MKKNEILRGTMFEARLWYLSRNWPDRLSPCEAVIDYSILRKDRTNFETTARGEGREARAVMDLQDKHLTAQRWNSKT